MARLQCSRSKGGCDGFNMEALGFGNLAGTAALRRKSVAAMWNSRRGSDVAADGKVGISWRSGQTWQGAAETE